MIYLQSTRNQVFLYVLVFFGVADLAILKIVKEENKMCVTQPEKAKCECACKRYFWLKYGNSNPILYLINVPTKATMARLIRAIRIKKSFLINSMLVIQFVFSNFHFATLLHFQEGSDDGFNPQSQKICNLLSLIRDYCFFLSQIIFFLISFS